MATRVLWGSLLGGRRGSSATEELLDVEGGDCPGSRRPNSSQVQTLGSMRSKPLPSAAAPPNGDASHAHPLINGATGSDLIKASAAAAAPASNSTTTSTASPSSKMPSPFDAAAPGAAPAAASAGGGPAGAAATAAAAAAAAGPAASNHASSGGPSAPAGERPASARSAGGNGAAQAPGGAHDSASSTVDTSDSGGHLMSALSAQQQQPPAAGAAAAGHAGPAQAAHARGSGSGGDGASAGGNGDGPAAAALAERALSLGPVSGALHDGGSGQPQQEQQEQLEQQQPASEVSFLPAPVSAGSAAAGRSPSVNNCHDAAAAEAASVSAAQPASPHQAPSGFDLLSELQNAAGLTPEQAAAAAALMQRFSAAGAAGAAAPSSGLSAVAAPFVDPNEPQVVPNPRADAPGTPSHATMVPGSPHQLACLSLGLAAFQQSPAGPYHQGQPGMHTLGLGGGGGGGFGGGPGMAQAAAYGAGAPGLLPTFDSFHSNASGGHSGMFAGGGGGPGSDGMPSGSGYAMFGGLPPAPGGAAGGGFMGGQAGGGYLHGAAAAAAAAGAAAAAYAHDGLDVPGTAQVAVHNVPFKWCNADLEALFKEEPGYLDAQLLFHENGRSKGVGVALFQDRAATSEVCGRLSGAQADGRKLELVLMNPDNHISFSCKQVAVLGLPWEYTAADVRALIEAAAEADCAAPHEAGVEGVEVAYRDDGKSEGRAIAVFRSRRQAHDAITRLHGKETLAGLRMRLFYLHEQQQRQHLMAHTAMGKVASLGQMGGCALPGMLGGLGLGPDTPSPRFGPAGGGQPGTPTAAAAAAAAGGSGNGAVRQLVFAPASASASGAAGRSSAAGGEGDGKGEGVAAANGKGSGSEAAGGEGGGGNGGAAAAASGDQDAGSGSGRSSLDKDQGPVILHVSGLMESVTREQLRELFSQAGEVTKVDIPDGGRSMGYGFITFSNPQAAEQAMLLFNNFPLGGGAIHVAYSTSATAKARQQALRQARKATLGWHGSSGGARPSGDGSGMKPTTPRGGPAGGAAAACGRRGPLPFSNPALASAAGALGATFGTLEPLQGALPLRHSFDAPGGYAPMGGGWRGASGPGGFGPGLSHSLGALAGTPPGMDIGAAAGFEEGRAGRPSYGPGMPAMSPSHLLGVGGVGPAAAAGGGMGAGFMGGAGGMDLSTGANLDQQLQLLMQLTGTAGDGGGGISGTTAGMAGLMASGAAGFGGGGPPPGTPPPAGHLRTGAMPGSLLSTPAGPVPGPAGSAFGMFGPGATGLSTPPSAGSFFGGNPAATPGSAVHPTLGSGSLFSPGIAGFGGLGPAGFGGEAAAAAGAMAAPVAPAAGDVQQKRQVLVTGLPAGLSERDVRMLFEVCGPLRSVTKVPEQDFAILSYDTHDAARNAIHTLDGTKLPSGGTLALQFTSLLPDTPAQPGSEAAAPGGALQQGAFGGGAPPQRSSFTGDAGALGSGSMFGGAVSEAAPSPFGSGADLFGSALRGGTGGFGSFGAPRGPQGPAHSGAPWGGQDFYAAQGGPRAGSPASAFGRPPRDVAATGGGGWPSGAALAATSLYSPSPMRAGSPLPGAGGLGTSPALPRAMAPGGLPPVYTAAPVRLCLPAGASDSGGGMLGASVGPASGPRRAGSSSSNSSDAGQAGGDGAELPVLRL